MNILYINHYAGSLKHGMEFRPYYLSREWVADGHKVRIVGGDYSHLRKENPTVSKSFETEQLDGIEYQWIKTGSYEGNGVKRALTMLRFVAKLWLKAGKMAKEFKPDAVISSSTYPLDCYAARRIAKKAKCKYVHEVHDMWPITPMELYGMSARHPFVVVMQWGENYFCKNADAVVSVLPCAKDYFVEHGMREDKFVYVPNGIELGDWEKPEALPEEFCSLIDKAKAEGRFIISFFGSHTRSYSLDYFLKALERIDGKRFFALFVGGGNYKQELEKMAESLGLDKDSYAFMPPIAKAAIPSLLEASDASYVGAAKNKMFRFGIGMNKLFDAMMGAKPILYAVDAPNNMIEQFECGVSVEAEDTEALAEGISKLLELDAEELARMGENGRRAVIENFNYKVLSKRFIDVIEGIEKK